MAVYVNGKKVAGAGKDATVNGMNTLNIVAGENVTVQQEGSILTINATGANALVITITDNAGTLSSDKTNAQIWAAYQAGTPMYAIWDGYVLMPAVIEETSAYFTYTMNVSNGSYDVGDTGGADSVTLTTAQMPSHSHGGSVSVTSGGAHTHELYRSNGIAGILPMLTQTSFRDAAGGISVGDDNVKNAGAHTHNATLSISSAGSGNGHENRPPYYALCYIMKQ